MNESLESSVTSPATGTTASPVVTHDLRGLFRAIGSFSGTRASNSVEVRTNCDVPVELIEESNRKIDAEPITVTGFVDGIQASLVVAHRDHRPVHLNYTAAAAMNRACAPVAFNEHLEIVISERDREWVDSLRTTVPVTVVGDADPSETERLAVGGLAGSRERLERELVDTLLRGEGLLALDGSLVARPIDSRLLGVIKTTSHRYLPDESLLWGLPMGWRSPIFRIPTGSQGFQADRYSCYLRLVDATNGAWDLGLIRLESLDPSQLDGLAALCLAERQHRRTSDPRGDRHLRPIRMCEEFLRARRPAVFSL